ncbi:MAG: glycosyltransferase [Ignavibacteriales bacterium]|nr:Undecaprenyl-phosphate 4-deoxy-4-formamido-L-arabinose transferase [Ignavibacteriaceae bacterium]MCZ2143463.1 glycosyltransferase [Ignavibacteriales bacterium]WKZ72214.1 MAG: glycosyltransferase [Ignavibacteriaceae bacterium]
MEKEKDELNNEKFNEQKPESADQGADNKASAVNGANISEISSKGNQDVSADRISNGSDKGEKVVAVSDEKIIVHDEHSHIYRIVPKSESVNQTEKAAQNENPNSEISANQAKTENKTEPANQTDKTSQTEPANRYEIADKAIPTGTSGVATGDAASEKSEEEQQAAQKVRKVAKKTTRVTKKRSSPATISQNTEENGINSSEDNSAQPLSYAANIEVEKTTNKAAETTDETETTDVTATKIAKDFTDNAENDNAVTAADESVAKQETQKETRFDSDAGAQSESLSDSDGKSAETSDNSPEPRKRQSRDNLRNHSERPAHPALRRTGVKDPTLAKLKVDKGLVKSPADEEQKQPVSSVDRREPFKQEDKKETFRQQDKRETFRTDEKKETFRTDEKKTDLLRESKPEIISKQEQKRDFTQRQNGKGDLAAKQEYRQRDRKLPREPFKPAERVQPTQSSQQMQQKGKFRTNFNKLSVVVPLFNEDESVQHLANEIKSAFKDLQMQTEVIFVDDGSTDKSLRVIKEICRTDQRFKYISFQMNYGKSAALNTGFRAAKGDVVITMDADLQDDPHEIPNLIRKLEEGYDMVSGWKKKRYDPFLKKYSSKLFNFVTSTMSGIKIHDFNCGLKAYRKAVIDNLNIYGEMHRYIPILAKWKGFSVAELVVKHSPRKYGVTKFGASRFFKGFVDLITVTFITRYIKRPMHLFGFFGALAFLLGFVINGYLSYEWIFEQQPLSNRPLLQLGMLLMIVGVQFFTAGLLGEMLVHNFQTGKEYSIKETNTRL